MKNSKIIIALTIVSLSFVACQKEELTTKKNNSEQIAFDFSSLEDSQNENIDLSSNTKEAVTITVRKESDCVIDGENLQVFEVIDYMQSRPLDLDKYFVEWFNEDYELLSETDEVFCVTTGNYLVIVWDKITELTATKTYTIEDKHDGNVVDNPNDL